MTVFGLQAQHKGLIPRFYNIHYILTLYLIWVLQYYFSPIVSSTRHNIVENSSVYHYHCFFLSTQQTYAWQRECLRQLFFHTCTQHSILWSICVATWVSMTTLPRIIRKVCDLLINMSVVIHQYECGTRKIRGSSSHSSSWHKALAHVRYVALLPLPGI